MPDIILNARFLTRAPTGVDRVANALIDALLTHKDVGVLGHIRVVRPPGAIVLPQERSAEIVERAEVLPGFGNGHLWEQFALARVSPDDWLLNLCNSGPLFRRRQVVMIHDAHVYRHPESYTGAFRNWYRFILPRLGKNAARILTVSEHARRDLAQFGIARPSKTIVITNGADHILNVGPSPDILGQHGLKEKGYFLAVGSPAPHKNLQMLIAAARAREAPQMPLVIAGRADPRVFQKDPGAETHGILHLERVTDAELRALYDNARALLFPSLTEGFGLPAAEAMMCGTAVIASNGGAIPEVCGGAAFLLDPKDMNGWRTAMQRAETDAPWVDALAMHAKKRATDLRWSRAADALLAVLKDL